jgi:hypothetical protein
LAEKIPPGLIDIILGGHDHYYAHSVINSTHVLRSGSDFRQLSYIEAWRKSDGVGWDFTITRRDLVRSIPEDPSTVELVAKLTDHLKSKLQKPIGYTATPLDGRFTTVRRMESNLGNFVCDLMRFYYGADCAIMAAGTIRGDQIYPPGVLRVKDILKCFPFEDPVVVLRVTGKALIAALENGVSELPALEGRFPQVSNISFGFSLSAPRLARVSWAKVNGKDIQEDEPYVLVTRGYMARGKDGYTSLLAKSEGGDAEELVSEENGVLVGTLLRQSFLSLKVLGKWQRLSASMGRHWDTVNEKLLCNGLLRPPSPNVSPKADKKPPIRSGAASPAPSFHYVPSQQPRSHSRSSASKSQSLHDASDPDCMDSESDGEPELLTVPRSYVTKSATSPEDADRREFLARRVVRKWRQRVGIDPGKVKTVREAQAEVLPCWTHGIAPVLEGRITQIDAVSECGQP